MARNTNLSLIDLIQNTDLAVYRSNLSEHGISCDNINTISDPVLIQIGIRAMHIHQLRQLCQRGASQQHQVPNTQGFSGLRGASSSLGSYGSQNGASRSTSNEPSYETSGGGFGRGPTVFGGASGLSGFNQHNNRVGPYSYKEPPNVLSNKNKRGMPQRKIKIQVVACAERDQMNRPEDHEKFILSKNGLGAETIDFDGNENFNGVYEKFAKKFPRLDEEGGGFLMSKTNHGQKRLRRFNFTSITDLYSQMNKGKNIVYLTPAQCDIELKPPEYDLNEIPQRRCRSCNAYVFYNEWDSHFRSCNNDEEVEIYESRGTRSRGTTSKTSALSNSIASNATSSDSTNANSNGSKQNLTDNMETTIVINCQNNSYEDYEEYLRMSVAIRPDSPIKSPNDFISANAQVEVANVGDTDTTLFDTDTTPKPSTSGESTRATVLDMPDLNYMGRFKSKHGLEGEWKVLNIRRREILIDTFKNINQLRSDNVVLNKPFVSFLREIGIDNGGVTRAFYSELIRSLKSNTSFLHGNQSRQLNFNAEAHANRYYGAFAKLLVHLALYADTSIELFDEKYFEYLITGDGEFCASEVIDERSRSIIETIENQCEWIRNDQVVDYLSEMNIQNVGHYRNNKKSLIKLIANYSIAIKPDGAITQFRNALASLGVLQEIKANISKFKSVFCLKQVDLVADDIISLFDFNSSPQPDNPKEIEQEEDTSVYLIEYTHKVAHEECFYEVDGVPQLVKLEHMLECFTGSSYIPYSGSFRIDVRFYNADFSGPLCSPLPKVATCSYDFNLPRNFPNYERFESVLNFLVMESKSSFSLA